MLRAEELLSENMKTALETILNMNSQNVTEHISVPGFIHLHKFSAWKPQSEGFFFFLNKEMEPSKQKKRKNRY